MDERPQLKPRIVPMGTDTVWIVYDDHPEDTIFTKAQAISGGNWILEENIDMHNDVTVILVNENRIYHITDFKYETRLCDECRKKEYTYKAFLGCKVNGVQTGSPIYLR
jgi:hypothetical protein